MNRLLLEIFLLLAALAKTCAGGDPPVLMWGLDAPAPDTIFKPVESEMLADFLDPLQENYMIVVYFAQELSPKDFLCEVPESSQKCFKYLSEVFPLNYYSQVRSPQRVVELFAYKDPDWQQLNVSAELQLQLQQAPICEPGLVHAFNFSDTHALRHQNLLAHDQFIASVSEHLKSCPVIQLYTAFDASSQHRERRADDWDQFKKVSPTPKADMDTGDVGIVQEPHNLTVLRADLGLLVYKKIVYAIEVKQGKHVYYRRLYIKLVDNELMVEVLNTSVSQLGFLFTLNTVKGPLQIEIRSTKGDWRVTQFMYQGGVKFQTIDLIFYSKTHSLCCTAITAYSPRGDRITIYDLYMDVITNENQTGTDPNYRPKPCWYCEIFITSGIAQATFTVIILISLLAFGFSMIWDIGKNSAVPVLNRDRDPLEAVR
ncbi:uncharacterized protein LOC115628573 [Scaptodrosophila lebanonensis]|uniref:Uncharacterized protein LOC115628573 n=1 Tax=Drosophila lebanonensis TaxID=7225 RepID=A0A6J2TVM1_DROLE|nr:uncharacterized protein LOC115628573 [Scaptodrosophila lebanonensis]